MDADNTRSALTERARGHWAHVIEGVIEKVAPKLNAAKMDHVTDLLETFERDLAPHLAPLLNEAMAHPDFPDALRPLFTEVASPTHLTSSLTVGIGIGAILSPAIGAVFAPLINEIADAAWTKLPGVELTPSEAAAGVLKGVLTEAQGAAEAVTSGLNAHRFGQLVELSGNAIGLAEALLLWRRGQITDAHLDEIIRYSNLNPKFYADVKKLRYAPPATGAVLAGAVANHLSEAEARTKYAEAGGNPDNYTWQFETSGRPPGIEQMLHLANRGIITEATVRQAVRESDIKTKYVDAIWESRVYLPPPRSIVPMLRHGAISEARARELLADHGLRPQDIDAFIAEAGHSGSNSARALTQSQIARMYGARFLSRGEATTKLTALNFPAGEITLLLDFVDEERRERFLNAGLTKVATLYVGHKIDKALATSSLAQLGMPGAAITELFEIWDVERFSAAPDLTVAQWQGALRRGLATHVEFDAAMNRHGYTLAEAEILAGLAFPPPKAPKAPNTRDLTAAQLVKLYQAGAIQLPELRSRLMASEYSADEANEIISLAAPPTTP